jgi:hypothetical protein
VSLIVDRNRKQAPNYCRWDNNAAQIGVNAPQFIELYKGQVDEMKHRFLDYAMDLHQQKDVMLVPVSNDIQASNNLIEVTPNGFPILPNVDFHTLKKTELESMMQAYLNQHYSMFLSCDFRIS